MQRFLRFGSCFHCDIDRRRDSIRLRWNFINDWFTVYVSWLVWKERRRLQFSSESRRIEIKNIVILILKNQLISNIKKIRKLININRYKYSISKSIPINFNYQKNLELIIKFILIIILPCHPLSFAEWITFELIHSLSTLLVRDTNIRTKPATEINDGEG